MNAQWQPIETAPHDGTVIDLWHKDGLRIFDSWWDAEDEIWVPGIFDNSMFSHWMKVEPPK